MQKKVQFAQQKLGTKISKQSSKVRDIRAVNSVIAKKGALNRILPNRIISWRAVFGI